jgi:universal stress protein A
VEVADRLQSQRHMKLRKLLCPTDFSAGARDALRTAIDLVAGSDAELVLVHVWYPPYVYSEATFADGLFADLRTDAEQGLAAWKSEAGKLGATKTTTMFLVGSAWHEVVEAAKRDPAIDMIVMGTHGRTGLKHVLLGSVAEKVVRHAPCPVLVARPRG